MKMMGLFMLGNNSFSGFLTMPALISTDITRSATTAIVPMAMNTF